ncbi:MAG: hypothetical protein IPL89_10845 [Acidobacteria bacterium]|nr:hypothetical protein [Acidobacteriota bacterium]
MITGFNTDVKHAERVYHVQTEDRGVANPVVESLVYVGGEILLSKKSPYKDLITGDRVDEKALREMMDLQHRRVIEAIRRGRLDTGKIGEAPSDWADDTLPSTDRVSPAALAAVHAILAAPSEPLPGKAPSPARAPGQPPPKVSTGQAPAFPPPASPAPAPAPPAPAPPPAPAAAPPTVAAPRKPSSGASPASASGAGTKRPGSGMRSLDQVIVDYLASEAASEHLELSLTSDAELMSGGKVTLTLKATTSLTEKPLPGVHVSIRVVSTVRPPQILFRGVTAGDGCVSSVCALPDIGTGNAALIIAASSPLGNNEIKQLIKKR